MAIQVNFNVDQGSTFYAVATIQNEDGSLFDLTGFTPYSQMRKSYYTKTAFEVLVSVENDDPASGNLRLTIPATVSNSMRAGRYVYDVEVHKDSDESVKRVMQGIITVSPQVTKQIIQT